MLNEFVKTKTRPICENESTFMSILLITSLLKLLFSGNDWQKVYFVQYMYLTNTFDPSYNGNVCEQD